MSTSDDALDLRQAAFTGLLAEVRELRAQTDHHRVEIETLKTALTTSRRIGAAVGVVMATLRVTEAQAFAVLREVSQSSNRKLRDIADDVVLTGVVEPTPPTRSRIDPRPPTRSHDRLRQTPQPSSGAPAGS